jgi:transcriptional regulator with XRE-family HTH domain
MNATLKEDKDTLSGPHPVDVHVGKRIRLRRNILGLSQEELGKAVGVTFQQIQKYERGANRVGSSRLYEFSKVLSVSVGYFFDKFSPGQTAPGFAEENEANEGFQYASQMDNKETLQLVQAYWKISSPKLRQRVISLVKDMANETNAG